MVEKVRALAESQAGHAGGDGRMHAAGGRPGAGGVAALND
jgi:hypothetical protein